MTPIVPAIIPKSLTELKEILFKLAFSSEVHVDVVDGRFVPFSSWPYDPLGEPIQVKEFTDSFTLEVDLMVEDTINAAKDWILAGADMLVFHAENTTLDEFKSFVQKHNVTAGISALNDTPLATLVPYLEWADSIQLMGIAKIGAQGQPFDERIFERIKFLKSNHPNLPITVDGSVNKETIARLKEAGADRFICGSAIVKAEDPQLAYKELQTLIN